MADGSSPTRVLAPLLRRARVWRALAGARRSSRLRLLQTRPSRLLVVCYGNIYRSPFVAALLARDAGAYKLDVRSSGFYERIGRETPEAFRKIVRVYGVDLDRHRSARIDCNAVNWADLVIVMDRHNWDGLRALGPAAQSKAIWLGAFLDEGSIELVDPYGCGPAEMQAIADRLYRATRGLQAFLAQASAACLGAHGSGPSRL